MGLFRQLKVIENLYLNGSLAPYTKIRESLAETEETIKICEYFVKVNIFDRGLVPDENIKGAKWRAYGIKEGYDIVVDNFNKRHLNNKMLIERYD